MLPLIKDRGIIDCQLDEKTVNTKKEHLQTLTPDEEWYIVEFQKTDAAKMFQ